MPQGIIFMVPPDGEKNIVLALGNGFLVSRAAAPEATDDEVHYPGTYRTGCYDQVSARIRYREEQRSLDPGVSVHFDIF